MRLTPAQGFNSCHYQLRYFEQLRHLGFLTEIDKRDEQLKFENTICNTSVINVLSSNPSSSIFLLYFKSFITTLKNIRDI
jgi:hypothetical protein